MGSKHDKNQNRHYIRTCCKIRNRYGFGQVFFPKLIIAYVYDGHQKLVAQLWHLYLSLLAVVGERRELCQSPEEVCRGDITRHAMAWLGAV